LASEWLSSGCWDQILHVELVEEQIGKTPGRATGSLLCSSTLPWSAQVYSLSFSLYHLHRSISEARQGLDTMTQDWLLVSKLIQI